MEKQHDYKDTIKQAAGTDESAEAEAKRRKRRTDAEIAYETLAVGAAMGGLGENGTQANLMQLLMMQEIDYKLRAENDEMVEGDEKFDLD